MKINCDRILEKLWDEFREILKILRISLEKLWGNLTQISKKFWRNYTKIWMEWENFAEI